MIINKPKLIAFIIATIMLFINIYIYGMNDNWSGILYIFLMYIILVLIALYDIGKDQPDIK
jgi:hypothetical protein